MIFCGEDEGVLPVACGTPSFPSLPLPEGNNYFEIGILLCLYIISVCIHNIYLVFLCFKI